MEAGPLTYLSQIYHQNRMVSQTFLPSLWKPEPPPNVWRRSWKHAGPVPADWKPAYLPPLPHPPRAPGRASFEPDLSSDGVAGWPTPSARLRRPLLRVFRGRWKRIPLRHVRPLRATSAPLIQAMHALQGRGGGKAQFVQGSLPASRRDIEAYFHANLFHSLGE